MSLQICTGLLLAPHYIPEAEFAFASVEHIMREVNYGWLFRYAHSNGASFIFGLMYLHIGRGLYYRSYLIKRGEMVWYSGMTIFVLVMLISFIGYVLPWGQMSFWAAVVITNLLTALPGFGQEAALWAWGGPAVSSPTLTRFYTLHFFLPFVLIIFILWHMTAVHVAGSTNPICIFGYVDTVRFFPYFYVKDLFAFSCVFFLFTIVVLRYPDALGHPDNYIPANIFITPKHIVPEWYFLPFFAILRAIPNKVLGILAMFSSIFIIFILPKIDTACHKTSPLFRPIFEYAFGFFILDFLLLGYTGTKPPIYPYLELSQICTLFYFVLCIFCFCLTSHIESYIEYHYLWNEEDHIQVYKDKMVLTEEERRLKEYFWYKQRGPLRDSIYPLYKRKDANGEIRKKKESE